MSADLKECPFCGGSACLDQADDGKHYVACSACHGSMGEMSGTWCGEGSAEFDSEADAVQAWNTRAIAPPVAAGSVDTVGFRIVLAALEASFDDDCMPDDCVLAHDNFIAHIDAWGAQQHRIGRLEGYNDGFGISNQRAEKAEADLKARDFFVYVLNCQVKKAEARVKELEADAMRWRYLRDLDHDLTGTAGQPCVALPNGMNSGYYLTGPEAIYAVDMSMVEAAQK